MKRHDEAVRRSAAAYKGQGYNVKADILNYPKPKIIGGRRPDLEVSKGGKRKIIEWETPSSMKSDVAQRSTFRKHARKQKNVSFRTRVVR